MLPKFTSLCSGYVKGGIIILNKILNAKQQEVAAAKEAISINYLLNMIVPGERKFQQALKQKDWALIAECKLASPVKGLMSGLSITELAKVYQDNGAAALSILTDRHFNGELDHVIQAKTVSSLPVLRKDFIIDEYQIYQARAVGADAVLLIVRSLTEQQLVNYLTIAHDLGMDCLVEVHDREELKRAQQTAANIIGINNRDLQTFKTSIESTFSLLPYCDPVRMIISESGIRCRQDAVRLKQAGVRGILVGEGLVKAPNIAQKLQDLNLNEVEEI